MTIPNQSRPSFLKIATTVLTIAGVAITPLALAHEPEHATAQSSSAANGKENLAAAATKEVTGEVVDMMCYVDHNAIGEKHGQSCGVKCVKGGGPVGIVENGKAYLVVGEHKPMNDQLADYCGKTVTLKGKIAERGGIALLENAEIVKK